MTIETTKPRARFHLLLEDAMNATPEGQSFVGHFANLVILAQQREYEDFISELQAKLRAREQA